MGKAAGVAAAVEGAVHAGNRFTGSVEAAHRLQIPAEDLQVIRHAEAAAGEVVPRIHLDAVERAVFVDLHRHVGAAELGVVLVFDSLVPERELILQTLVVNAGLLRELFKRIGAEEVLAELKLFFDAFFVPGGQTDQGAGLVLRTGRVIDLLIHEGDVVSARVHREMRGDVADAFLFRDETLAVRVDQDAAVIGEVPEAAVRTIAAACHNAARVRCNILHVGKGHADVAHGNAHGRAVVSRAADRDTLAGNGRNPEVEGLRGAGDAAGGENHALAGTDIDLFAGVKARGFNAGDDVLLRIKIDAGKRGAGIDFDLAGIGFLHEDVNIVLALIGFLTDGAQVAVTGVLFQVMRSKAVVFEPVEGFAGVLGKEFHRFLERHIAAVVHDVVSEFLPGVLGVFALLDRGAISREEAAAHAGGGVIRAVALVDYNDRALLIDDLAGSHEACAAGTGDNYVNRDIPLGGSGRRGRGSESRSRGSSTGSGSSRAEEMTAGKRLGHDLFSLELAVSDCMAVAADEVALLMHGVACGAFHAAHMGIMRIELFARLGSLLGKLFIGAVALQAGLLGRSSRGGLTGVAGFALEAGVGAVGTGSKGCRRCKKRRGERCGKGCLEREFHDFFLWSWPSY